MPGGKRLGGAGPRRTRGRARASPREHSAPRLRPGPRRPRGAGAAQHGGSFDVGSLTQLLTVAPNEDLESERVRIAGGTVVAETEANRFDVRLTSDVVVEVFSPVGAAAGLCPGATFDAVGVVQELQGRHNLFVGQSGDLTNVNTAACP